MSFVRSSRPLLLASACLLACGPASATGVSAPDASNTAQLRVTQGALALASDGSAEITTPSLRAQLARAAGERAELRFTYLGPSEHPEPLASGEVREQLGLKLRARDSCNVVYAMWRLSTPASLSVSVKANLDAKQHSDCGDRGYATIAPTATAPLPAVRVGEPHTLVALLGRDRLLRIYADAKLVWSGALPEVAFAFDGPAGLRSDNVRARIAFYAPSLRPGDGPAARAQ